MICVLISASVPGFGVVNLWTIGLLAFAAVIAAAGATLWPARQATRVDPLLALRTD